MKWLLILLVCLPVSVEVHAQTCTGSSPTWTAGSSSYADVNYCVSTKATNGDTVVIPSGSSTWTTTLTLPAIALTLQGQTTCTPSIPGSTVTTCVDNTSIDDQGASGGAIIDSNASASHFHRITGITFVKDTNHSSGIVQITGTYGQVGFRFDHNHIIESTTGSRGFYADNTFGLVDHNWFDVEATSGSNQLVSIDGTPEGGDGGFTSWLNATPIGTANNVIMENNLFFTATADAGNEDIIDCYSGASITVRYNQLTNSTIGCHGFDSGNVRSPILVEVYSNTFTNNSSSTLSGGGMRGGAGVWHDNTYVTGSGSHGYNSVKLSVYRNPNLEPDNSSQWGACDGHQNWVLGSVTYSDQAARQCDNQGSDWQANHTYTVSGGVAAVIYPTSNNAGNYNYAVTSTCVSGASRSNPFNQTVTSSAGTPTTSDNTCAWINEGGGPPAATVKFCAANPDTVCIADATCAALHGGDTCSRYVDGGTPGAASAGYPCRDQVGRGHNQTLTPIYEWNNTGTGAGLSTNSSGPPYLTSGVDYYTSTTMPGYNAYQYPDPLQGMGTAPAGQMLAKSSTSTVH